MYTQQPQQAQLNPYSEQRQPRQSQFRIQRQRNQQSNPILSVLQNLQRILTNLISKVISFFTTLPFKIIQKLIYFIEKGIRYLIWINIKGLVSWVNFLYRFFAFFRINKLVSLLQMIAQTYFPQYSMVDFNRVDQIYSRFSLLVRKKNYDLINVDKLEKKVKTPTLFQKYTYNQTKNTRQQPLNQDQQQQNLRMIRQGKQNQNQSVSPRLVRLSQSHEKIQKNPSNRGLSRGSDLRVQVPQQRNASDRVFPDRDISPQRYMKPIPKIGQLQPEDLKLNENDSEYARQQLQKQLYHLRGKMQQLIEDNKNYIQDLQEWLKQKSQTIMMTRSENIQLLQEMQQLQQQNIKKTQRLGILQEKIKQFEEMLEKQKSQTGELCNQIVKLNEEITSKSIEIVVLKDRINKNLNRFRQLQELESVQVGNKQRQSEKVSEEEQRTMEKLRQQEKRTQVLAEKVQKVLNEERKRLHESELEPNLILDDPRQVENEANKENTKKQEQNASNTSGKQRKQSQPRVLKSDGTNRITMTVESKYQ